VHGYEQGVFVHRHRTRYADVLGRYATVEFEIVDRRFEAANAAAKDASVLGREYVVSISRGSSRNAHAMLYKVYDAPGVYEETIDLGRLSPQSVTLVLSMVNDRGLVFEHPFVVAYNVNFFRPLKWLVALPLFLGAGLLALGSKPVPEGKPVLG